MVHLIEQYPEIPFIWLDFEYGGDGVFMLTREQLIEHHAHLSFISINQQLRDVPRSCNQ